MSLRRSRLRAATVLAACITALAPATAGATESPGDQPLQRQLDAFVNRTGGPPGAVAVLRTENGTRVVRAGVADVGTDRRPGPDDHMRIASTAKAFSGAVALTLVDRRALRLDDTLGERLPQLPDAWASVTLGQLLGHTSGLPDYSKSDGFVDELRADPLHHFDSRHLLDYIADDPLLFKPGTQYRYSNSDNIAVALMAEAVTHKPYEELLRDLVYAPLGLESTSLPQGNRMPEPYLHGYDVSQPATPQDVSEVIGMSGVWASGGIVSTPADMTRFIRGYAAGRLYGRTAVEQQRQWVEGASEPAGPGRNSAGLAVFRYETRCGVVLGHTGNTLGYTQLIAATPDGRRSLTFSVTAQITQSSDAQGLQRMRALQENFVCALLRDRNR
ncbi:serine hydrolase domain-containing protein [Streptomyces sp. SAI-041]|uniref:serine hydrolase domain-containing protein n=1 Tax=Streptomyces sp. SAI-041 TaxID=2940548 RepID=UPI002472F728|nr:serine hydrolase domain-containing protein [Streptomyces sp. SAI-041]MDH6546650.1 D-alanyl-D-alanine carboxypeptidase [Streptomyces sp. SAI-041]